MRDAGSLLVRAGLIDSDALAQARTDRAKTGGTLAEHLVLAGVVGDDELTQFFRERLMVPRVSSERLRAVPTAIISRIPAELASELRVVPVSLDAESSLTVAMSDPSDTHALDELEFFTEHYVVRAVASQRQIAWCLDHYYGVATPLLDDGGVESSPFIDVKTDVFVDAKTDVFVDAKTDVFVDAKTDVFDAKTDVFVGEPRPRRLSEAVRSARHRVVPPATAPPPVRAKRGTHPMEATLEDLAVTEGLFVGEATDIDVPAADYELVLDDDDHAEIELLSDHPEIELDADEPDSIAVTHALADGSPGELAPRVGEVLVNRRAERNSDRGPAVVLDDSLFKVSAQPEIVEMTAELDDDSSDYDVEIDDEDDDELEAPEPFELVLDDDDDDDDNAETTLLHLSGLEIPHLPVDEDSEATGEIVSLEADEPDSTDISDGTVRSAIERGTDSAPILLSEVKRAVENAERAQLEAMADESDELREDEEPGDDDVTSPEIHIEPADDGVDESSVVLLEMPKRHRRSTALGVSPAPQNGNVLGLRTQGADDLSKRADDLSKRAYAHLASQPPAERAAARESGPPVITDDQDNTRALAELDSEARGGEVTIDDGWESSASHELPRASASMSGIEAAAVAELEGNWGTALDDQGGDRDRVLDTIEALARADNRDEIVAAVLDYLDQYCDRVVFLALKSGALEPFQIRSSQPLNPPDSARLPLREVSLLRDIVDTRLPYRGPLQDEPSQRLLLAVFGELSADGLAVPVAVRGRVVGLLYGDGISASLSGDSVGMVTQAAGRALERSLKRG